MSEQTQTLAEPARELPVSRGIGLGMVALLGFFAVALFLQMRFPAPEVTGVTEKLRRMRGLRGVDTVFIGSSMVRRQIDPAVFDEKVAARGHELHSFNLGIDGMRPPETEFVLDQFLALRKKGVKWMLIEEQDLYTHVAEVYVRTVRAVYWHDWRRATLTTSTILRREITRETAGDFLVNWQLFGKNALSVGRGADLLSAALHFPRSDEYRLYGEPLGQKRDGFFYVDREMTSADEAAFAKDLADMRLPANQAVMDAATLDYVRGIKRRLERAGITPIFVLPPDSNARSLPPENLGQEFWNFNDPVRYPELYRAENRYDSHHLNARGAQIWTALLAARMGDFLDKNPAAKTP